MGIITGYALIFIWLFLPMILIFKSSHTSGFKKVLWAVGTFFPFLIALSITKIVQKLAPTNPWASEIFNSTLGAFLLVMALLVGGWIVHTIYNGIYKNKFLREDFPERQIVATEHPQAPSKAAYSAGKTLGHFVGRLFK
jgi:hypothetical protein